MNISDFQCPVCCTRISKSEGFSIGQCSHKFCKACCIQHIEARLALFEEIRCLNNICSEKLTQKSIIYKDLSTELQGKFLKYEQFAIIKSNPNFKPCHQKYCLGVINIQHLKVNSQAQLNCQKCKAKHCQNCYQLAHENPQLCLSNKQRNQNQQNQTMRALHYRKCPNCSIWVERNGGCQYLTCKCKTQFCFACGQKFENDPCRKLSIGANDTEIRNLSRLGKLFKKPQDTSEWPLFVSKLIIKLIIIIIFTILFNISFLAILFGIFIPLVYLVSPAALFIMYGEANMEKKLRIFLSIITILLFPLIGAIAAVGTLLLLISYPIMRHFMAAHIYDQMDSTVYFLATLYLSGVHWIINI